MTVTPATAASPPRPRGDVDMALVNSLQYDLRVLLDPSWRTEGRKEAYRTLGFAWGGLLKEGAVYAPDGVVTDVTVALAFLDKNSSPRKVPRDAAHRLPHADATTRIVNDGGPPRHYLPINPDGKAAVIAAAQQYLTTLQEIEIRYLESLAANASQITRLRDAIKRAETAAAAPAPPPLEPSSAT
jgi:hypothetical protein